MALTYGDNTYGNALRNMVTNPNSFQGTPGFQFALNNGLNATARGQAAGGMRGSGNALAALTQYATGLASQDYGSQMDRLTRAAGQEEQYDVGMGQNSNTASLGHERNANDLTLGLGQNQNVANRNANDLTLGLGQNANTAARNANDFQLGTQRNNIDQQGNQLNFGLGMFRASNDYDLGLGQNANNAQRNQYDYNLGLGQNANNAAANQNQFNLGMFNAQTGRGNALADIYFRNRAAQPHSLNTPGGFVTTTPRF